MVNSKFWTPSLLSWQAQTKTQILGEHEIHVWRACLDRDATLVAEFQQLLSDDERNRAERFFFEKERSHFSVARGLLRIILAQYLDQDPKLIQFRYSKFGKPSLAYQDGDGNLFFNLSHSSGYALYAFTRFRKIGIDVERIIEDFPCEEIAVRFFSPRERKELLEIETGKPRVIAFFSCWTRKEAYIKARGEGLSIPLDQFDVSVSPSKPAKLLANRINQKEVSRWTLMDVSPGPGFVATLAADGHELSASFWKI